MQKKESDKGNTLLRVATYYRLSDEDKNKQNKSDDSESIKNQKHLLLNEIAQHPEFVLVDEYCDEDLSGAGTYRPEFERLIKDCSEGKIDIVLCKSQSRFSRDMEIIEKYLHNKFVEWNVRFISLSDNADTSNPGNKKARQINGLVNEWYLEDVSNNIRSAFQSKMNQGEFISPFASYGYEISKEDNNKLIIDPVASRVVKDIYNLYLLGLGFTGIAKKLNSENVPCPSLYKYQKGIKLNVISNRPRNEIKWTTNAIKTILTNELYIGHLIQGKRTTVSYKNHKIINKDPSKWIRKENMHEAIIDFETFRKVQLEMRNRTKPIKNTGIVHILSGKVFCLECGHSLRKKNSAKHEYLVCSNNRDGYNDCINKNGIRYDVLENIILNAINNKINKFFDEEILKKEECKNHKNNYEDRLIALERDKKEIEKNTAKIKNYLKSIYEDKVNGIITLEQFKELLDDYNKSEKDYKEQIKRINEDISFYNMKNEELVNNNIIFSKYKKLHKLNRVVINEFIDKVYIGKINKETNTRDIQIEWNFKI